MNVAIKSTWPAQLPAQLLKENPRSIIVRLPDGKIIHRKRHHIRHDLPAPSRLLRWLLRLWRLS